VRPAPGAGPCELVLFFPAASKSFVLLFSRILDFTENQVPQEERRREQRYSPGRSFPLQATIEVDGEPRLGRVLDLSPGGVGLHVSGPTYSRGSTAKLHLMLEDSWMEFPCRIAHIRSLPIGCRLGLTALFSSFDARKAYLQLIQPVALGSAFHALSSDEIRQTEPGVFKLTYLGRPGSELNVWRRGDETGAPQSFLLQMDDYLIQGNVDTKEMQIFSQKFMIAPTKTKPNPSFRKLPANIKDEIRLLFRWTMLNLPKDIPADIRTFLQDFDK
jgi:hypothetical protein